jgi:hypothetical protein
MAKEEFDINSLRIATPCPVGWDSMTGDERKRFCGLCSLNVYNISEMTRAQVETLVGNADGRICMRMYRRADGTVITKDCPVGLRTYRKRAATYVSAAFGAILGLFSVGFGQSRTDATDLPKITIERAENLNGKSMLTGKAIDITGAVLGSVVVTIFDVNNKSFVTTSDNTGSYSFSEVMPGQYKLNIKTPGFLDYKIEDLYLGGGEKIILNSVLNIDDGVWTMGVEATTAGTEINPDFFNNMPIRNTITPILLIAPATRSAPTQHRKP